ncbi:transcriptional regulator with XRE-family HTH domain [Bacillus pakistanensis]|uniref:Transcriptional regulator with XRE-family HTH domain n=1 Tax=Rossellomorea pakistanensis TaxID=992288 RepID=A0ABS2NEH6_9BACI|nr:helix-turn-helix domain-containing protein [Bacillus pakistanensis]MBM7586262.1 transcriptional regulator with XRE-family HTH domain [Bacillus pakistanensis]
MSHFGQHLLQYRKQRKMSQQELALKTRLGSQTIEKYESGLQLPDTQTILKLSTVLDIPASELLEKEYQDSPPLHLDPEIEQLVNEIGTKKAKLILRKAKEFSEEDFLRVMQMLYKIKYEEKSL